ncbi:MAG TPA: sulfotransferase domain-containing protein [Acidimicrobiales bacterium]|nr:sulfotransferase domain-containing protein [Acidimicrobiales bacterium]
MVDALKGFISNSERWDAFAFRDGDIVIATPAKCGTTWTQRIVSLLVFDSPELYRPLSFISPWLDMNTRPLDEVLADLDAQTHRRFVKSHLDFDHLPHRDDVTYITVGRDPRDAAVSWQHHEKNMNLDALFAARAAAVGLDDLAEVGGGSNDPPVDRTPAEAFWNWIEAPGEGFDNLVTHIKSYWRHRDADNVVMLHYGDLQRDLPGQMAYLADRLGISLSRERIDELAPFATFDAMKSDPERNIPNIGIWNDGNEFFHKGESGQWRALATDDEMARYDKRVAELCDPELAHWLHHGTLG